MSKYPRKARIKDVAANKRTWDGDKTLEPGTIVDVYEIESLVDGRLALAFKHPILGATTYNRDALWLISSNVIEFIADPPIGDDPVNHPKHYTSHPSGIECIEVTRHFNFNLGNVIKYLWRAPLKGATIQDLEKAAWYLKDEIDRRKKQESTQPETATL